MNENENIGINSYEIDLKDIIDIFFRRIKLMAIIIFVFGLLFFLVSAYIIEPVYTAKVTMYVNNAKKTTSDTINYNDLSASQKLVNSYVEIVKSNTVLKEVARKTNLGYDEIDLSKKLGVSPVNETEIFAVTIKDTDPEKAKLIVNTIAEVAPEKIVNFVEASSVKVIDYADTPELPTSPNILLNTFIGFVLGGIVSVILVILMETLDTRIKGEDDLEKLFTIPIIGVIPKIEETDK